MAEAVQAVLTAIKDIVKFKAVGYINSGDKTLDNLLNTLILTIIAIAFTTSYYTTAWQWLRAQSAYIRPVRNFNNVNVGQRTIFEQRLKKNEKSLMRLTWSLTNEPDFTRQFLKYVYELDQIVHGKFIDTNTLRVESTELVFDVFRARLDIDDIYILFVSSQGYPVGMCRFSNGNVYLMAETKEPILEFIKVVKQIEVTNEPSTRPNLLFVSTLEKEGEIRPRTSEIYANRTLDMFTSKYKPMLMNHLRDFQLTLKTQLSSFNGFGTYNLGIILYGKPGTGKTSVIKGICNQLNRSALVINMEYVKTASKFKELIKNNVDRVLVFEEFDCVDGIVSRELKERTSNHEHAMKELKEEYLKLLQLQTKSLNLESKESSKNEKGKSDKSHLEQELEDVKSAIQKLNDRLTLYTFLTVLDGMDEMRGRIMVATTNHIDHIDPALLRPGRFDLKIKLEEFTVDETREMLHKMFKGDKYESDIDDAKFPNMRYTPVDIITICHTFQTLPAVIRVMTAQKTPDSGCL